MSTNPGLEELIPDFYEVSKFPDDRPQDFLPNGSVDKIVTRGSIIQELGAIEHSGPVGRGSKAAADENDLINFILKAGKKVFTISLISGLRHNQLRKAMIQFRNNGYVDEELPFNVPIDETDHPCFPPQLWSKLAKKDFQSKQWMVIVPVFPAEFKKLELEQGHIFPFIFVDEERKEGTFGNVYQVTIHETHQEKPMRKANGGPANVAIKELKALGQKDDPVYKEWMAEAKALEETSSLEHPHVVQAMATISKERRHYFMFPWADRGSLRDLCKRNPEPNLQANLINDIIQQMVGLAGALWALHNFKDEGAYRHGDLKPENILIFGDGTWTGTWKIADMGLAKRHITDTSARGPTSTRHGTPSYEPPEAYLNTLSARSRLYDIWSMGCITLELIIWLLYGYKRLIEFNNSMNDPLGQASPYWDGSDLDEAPVPRSAVQIGLPELPEAGSNHHFEILGKWLDDCDRNHPQCKPSRLPCLPTRLIYVGTQALPVLKLYETQPGENLKYFALSHPWGSPPHFCTFNTNIQEHKQAIEFNKLPRTFQHAVIATRGLGVQYLWIDSLCIVQGRDGDFQREAKRMEDVFSQADCILAASSATGQGDGFLHPRQTRNYLTLQQPSRPPVYVCEYIDDFNEHVRGSYLNQRGWVLQERALARRTIYFTSKQTYWECGGGVRCETMTKMHNTLESFLGDPAFPKIAMESSHGGKIRLYQDLYMQYSRLAFTHQQDRPVAIAGLEKRLIHNFGVRGGFGIFDGDDPGQLRRSLLWHRASDVATLEPIDFMSDRGLASGTKAPPTWSWMAYKGGIEYLDLPFGQVEWEEGDVLPVGTWNSKEGSASDLGLSVVARSFNANVATAAGEFIYDVPGQTSGLSAALKCIVLGRLQSRQSSTRTHFVLLVTTGSSPVARGGKVYHRVGVGSVPGSWIQLDGPAKIGRML
ncbi:hypothetical protein VMCG_01821 [Cytospora schulzeri]|uniref:Protein kinase domain-containing protein n=1 Tax=Cytospora schulzeri TaxID=448051 RepID=A0A423X3L0_9PEZI|nr:hypothetical protein VMCG_01821 [Valsa malicola]